MLSSVICRINRLRVHYLDLFKTASRKTELNKISPESTYLKNRFSIDCVINKEMFPQAHFGRRFRPLWYSHSSSSASFWLLDLLIFHSLINLHSTKQRGMQPPSSMLTKMTSQFVSARVASVLR